MNVQRSAAAPSGGRVPYLVWRETGGEALLVDWDGPIPDLVASVERERLRPVWHACTSARDPGAQVTAQLVALYPALRTAWYAGCGTLRFAGLRVDVLWTPYGAGEGHAADDGDDGSAGLSFVVDERVAFVGALPAAAAARDERAARSLEVVREYASAATLYPAVDDGA